MSSLRGDEAPLTSAWHGFKDSERAVRPLLRFLFGSVVANGMLGGFLLQGLLGGVAALIMRPSDDGGWIQRGAAAVVAAVPGVLTLSVLDWIVGTW